MILSKDLNPEQQAYCVGAEILELLKTQEKGKPVDILDLKKYNDETSGRISIESILLAADWLFMLGLVEISSDGNGLVRCS